MPLPWLIAAAVTAAAIATSKKIEEYETIEERVVELDVDKTKNLISTLQRLKEKGSINNALSLDSEGLGFGSDLEKKLENLPVLSNQNVMDILSPHLNELLKPLKEKSIEYVSVKRARFK